MVGQLCWSCTRASGNSRASERYCTQVVMCINQKFVRSSALSARDAQCPPRSARRARRRHVGTSFPHLSGTQVSAHSR